MQGTIYKAPVAFVSAVDKFFSLLQDENFASLVLSHLKTFTSITKLAKGEHGPMAQQEVISAVKQKKDALIMGQQELRLEAETLLKNTTEVCKQAIQTVIAESQQTHDLIIKDLVELDCQLQRFFPPNIRALIEESYAEEHVTIYEAIYKPACKALSDYTAAQSVSEEIKEAFLSAIDALIEIGTPKHCNEDIEAQVSAINNNFTSKIECSIAKLQSISNQEQECIEQENEAEAKPALLLRQQIRQQQMHAEEWQIHLPRRRQQQMQDEEEQIQVDHELVNDLIVDVMLVLDNIHLEVVPRFRNPSGTFSCPIL